MLEILVPGDEYYDEENNEFLYSEAQKLCLEHSLVSLSKWESKWNKAFLGNVEKTDEEILDYVRCMTIGTVIDMEVYYRLTTENYDQIKSYIDAPMTATVFGNLEPASGGNEIITAELIYYWMIVFNIPVEFQEWHLNRLLTLIRVCNIKNAKPKKYSMEDTIKHNTSLNALNRKRFNSKG